jgi:hypothetical protein
LNETCFFVVSNPLCLSPSLALHFFRLFFSCLPPCPPGWPASLALQSCMAVFSKRTIVFLLRIKLHEAGFHNLTCTLNFIPRREIIFRSHIFRLLFSTA